LLGALVKKSVCPFQVSFSPTVQRASAVHVAKVKLASRI
jgi:hypothetical protein